MAPFLPFVVKQALEPWQEVAKERKQKKGKVVSKAAQVAPAAAAGGGGGAGMAGMLQKITGGKPEMGGGAGAGGGVISSLSPKLPPGRPMPSVTLHTVQGGKIQIGAPTGRWMLIVVYRGKHDPVSRNYLVALQQILGDLEELGVELVAVSGDPRERAEAFVETLRAATQTKEVNYKIAYGLPLHSMAEWGLYISDPRNSRETDRPFPEPAMFVVNPDGLLHISDYSNSPFARPDIRILVEGIRYIQENDYPIRGTYGVSVEESEWTTGTDYETQNGGY